MAAPNKKQLAGKIIDLLERKGDISQRGRLIAHVINELKLTSSSTIRVPMTEALLYLEREGTVVIDRRGTIMDAIRLVKVPEQEKEEAPKATKTSARAVRKPRTTAAVPVTASAAVQVVEVAETPAPAPKAATPASMPAKKVVTPKTIPVPSPPAVKLTVTPAPEQQEEVPATADHAAAPTPMESKATDEVAPEAKPVLSPMELMRDLLERGKEHEARADAAEAALATEQEAHAATLRQRNAANTAKGEAERKLAALQVELGRKDELLENERTANASLEAEKTRLTEALQRATEANEQAAATIESLQSRDDITELAARVQDFLQK